MTVRIKTARVVTRAFAAFGAIVVVLLIVGLVRDVQSFDQTRGGYEPPYTGYTGSPIDWSTLDVTPTGMARRGHVLNFLVDCTTGMISIEIGKLEVPFRELSPRALAVHRPREACEQRGFEPAF